MLESFYGDLVRRKLLIRTHDYDLLVIVDREVYATGYEYSKTGVIAHYNILSLNHLYIQCNRAYEL